MKNARKIIWTIGLILSSCWGVANFVVTVGNFPADLKQFWETYMNAQPFLPWAISLVFLGLLVAGYRAGKKPKQSGETADQEERRKSVDSSVTVESYDQRGGITAHTVNTGNSDD